MNHIGWLSDSTHKQAYNSFVALRQSSVFYGIIRYTAAKDVFLTTNCHKM